MILKKCDIWLSLSQSYLNFYYIIHYGYVIIILLFISTFNSPTLCLTLFFAFRTTNLSLHVLLCVRPCHHIRPYYCSTESYKSNIMIILQVISRVSIIYIIIYIIKQNNSSKLVPNIYIMDITHHISTHTNTTLLYPITILQFEHFCRCI